jgi:hypothetical protein
MTKARRAHDGAHIDETARDNAFCVGLESYGRHRSESTGWRPRCRKRANGAPRSVKRRSSSCHRSERGRRSLQARGAASSIPAGSGGSLRKRIALGVALSLGAAARRSCSRRRRAAGRARRVAPQLAPQSHMQPAPRPRAPRSVWPRASPEEPPPRAPSPRRILPSQTAGHPLVE